MAVSRFIVCISDLLPEQLFYYSIIRLFSYILSSYMDFIQKVWELFDEIGMSFYPTYSLCSLLILIETSAIIVECAAGKGSNFPWRGNIDRNAVLLYPYIWYFDT